ncbi:MAG: MFS transporter [Fimbriimonadaceae bacterium]|nr:MFS transporter [Chthonomonadaceae bacterium]MCO5295897.1 MFS transporter [Fimbriimonadaceae bacterium]
MASTNLQRWLEPRICAKRGEPARPKSVGELLSISAYWLATNVHWTALLVIVLPREVAKLSGSNQATALGGLMSIGAAVSLVVPLIFGPMSDRCASWLGRRRPFVISGTVVNLLGLALMYEGARLASFVGFLLGYLVVQIGNNVAMGAYNGVIPDLVEPGQRGLASGFMGLMTQLGSAAGVVGAGVLMRQGYVQATYVLLGGVLAVMLGVTIARVREAPIEPVAQPLRWKPYLASLVSPLRHPDFRWVWITRALVMLGFYTVQPYLQYYLRDVIGTPDPVGSAAKVFVIVLIGATISGLIGGWLSDRIGRKPVVYAANVLMATMAIALVACRNLEQALAVGVIFGLGYGAYISVDWALGTDVLPSQEDAGKDMAVWHIAMVFPQSIASPIAGVVLAAFGHTGSGDSTRYHVSGYMAIFGIAAAFLILGAVLLRHVRGAR